MYWNMVVLTIIQILGFNATIFAWQIFCEVFLSLHRYPEGVREFIVEVPGAYPGSFWLHPESGSRVASGAWIKSRCYAAASVDRQLFDRESEHNIFSRRLRNPRFSPSCVICFGICLVVIINKSSRLSTSCHSVLNHYITCMYGGVVIVRNAVCHESRNKIRRLKQRPKFRI